jgi:hypothetical protein
VTRRGHTRAPLRPSVEVPVSRPRWAPVALALAVLLVLLAAAPAGASHERRALVPESALDRRPWRGIVLIVTGERSICTGFIIGQRKIATAGHCLVRDPALGDYRRSPSVPGGVVAYRAYSRTASRPLTFPACRIASAWIHPRFVRGGKGDARYGSRDHDLAVLTTAPSCVYPRSAVLRMSANGSGGDDLPVGTRTRLAGYPSDERISRADGLHLWQSLGHVLSAPFDPARLFVTGYVGRGMSGGPVLRRAKDDPACPGGWCVIGVLTECSTNGQGQCLLGKSPRGTVRITSEVKRTLLRR